MPLKRSLVCWRGEGRGGEMEMVFVVAAVEVIIIVIKVDKFSIYMTRPTTDRQPRDVF